MKLFYYVPTATLQSNIPAAVHHRMVCPGLPAWSVVLVELWSGHGAQDAWEALPGVTELYPENMGITAPAAVLAAFAPWGAIAGMTLRQVFNLIRAQWPIWRHN